MSTHVTVMLQPITAFVFLVDEPHLAQVVVRQLASTTNAPLHKHQSTIGFCVFRVEYQLIEHAANVS